MDGDAFYRDFAAVVSTFVGFLGGFFIVRLQTYIQEWRDLRLELERLSGAMTGNATMLETIRTGLAVAPAAPLPQEEDLEKWIAEDTHALAPLVWKRDRSRFPREIYFGATLQLALFAVGVCVPLSRVQHPAGSVVVMVSCAALVVAMVVGIVVLAAISWRGLKADRPETTAPIR